MSELELKVPMVGFWELTSSRNLDLSARRPWKANNVEVLKSLRWASHWTGVPVWRADLRLTPILLIMSEIFSVNSLTGSGLARAYLQSLD